MNREPGRFRRHPVLSSVLAVGLLASGSLAGGAVYLQHELHDRSGLGPLPDETPEFEAGTVSYVCFADIPNCDETSALATLASSDNHIEVTLDQVDDDVEIGLEDTEDTRFYSHDGVDDESVARAIIHNGLNTVMNLIENGELKFDTSEGASTLEMQLARNLYLRDRPVSEGARKRWEAKTALKLNVYYENLYRVEPTADISKEEARRLTKYYAKRAILEKYLNTVYFGRGAYGVEAASWAYFGHSANEMTVPEADIIVALVNKPSRLEGSLDPTRNDTQINELRSRAAKVLQDRVEQGDLTAEQAAVYRGQPATILPYNVLSDSPVVDYSVADALGARHYLDDVLEQVEETGLPLFANLRINTTLSYQLQAGVRANIESAGFPRDGRQLAAVVMRQDGGIAAEYAGDYGFSQYNLITAPQPLGSRLKVVGYAGALMSGQIASIYDTYPLEPIDFNTYPSDTGIVWPGGDNGKDWIPRGGQLCRNLGEWTVLTAIARSCNDAILQVMKDGSPQSLDTMYKLMQDFYGASAGMTPLPAWTLGQAGISVLDYTTIYNGIYANRGASRPARIINDITALEGGVFAQKIDFSIKNAQEKPSHQVLPVEIADQLIEAGTLVSTQGTASNQLSQYPFIISAKTGTETDNRTAGITASYPTANGNMTVSVHYGYVKGLASLGDGVQGGNLPAKVAGQIAAMSGVPGVSLQSNVRG